MSEPQVTHPQLRMINILSSSLKLSRDESIALCSRAACRPISTRAELTRIEASWAIEALRTWETTGTDMTAREHHPELEDGAA